MPIKGAHVLLVHPQFRVLGGAELVSLRILGWLTRCHGAHVTLLTEEAPDLTALSRIAGLDIDWSKVTIPPSPVPRELRRFRDSWTLVKMAFLHRQAKLMAKDFDLCIGTGGEIDFARKGLQNVNHPTFAQKAFLRQYMISGRPSILDRSVVLDALYRFAYRLISRDTREGYRQNITTANSHFIAGLMRKVYGIECSILYPIFADPELTAASRPWEERRFRFVTLGRLSAEKGYLNLLDVYQALAKRFSQAEFMIVGRPDEHGYIEVIRRRIAEFGLGVSIVTTADRKDVTEILGNSKYYIHSKPYEHFGLAVAESVQCGCIPFVPDSGGQIETVPDPILRYKMPEDVVHAVVEFERDPQRAEKVRSRALDHVDALLHPSFFERLELLLETLSETDRERTS